MESQPKGYEDKITYILYGSTPGFYDKIVYKVDYSAEQLKEFCVANLGHIIKWNDSLKNRRSSRERQFDPIYEFPEERQKIIPNLLSAIIEQGKDFKFVEAVFDGIMLGGHIALVADFFNQACNRGYDRLLDCKKNKVQNIATFANGIFKGDLEERFFKKFQDSIVYDNIVMQTELMENFCNGFDFFYNKRGIDLGFKNQVYTDRDGNKATLLDAFNALEESVSRSCGFSLIEIKKEVIDFARATLDKMKNPELQDKPAAAVAGGLAGQLEGGIAGQKDGLERKIARLK